MKIAITADSHLTMSERHPERWKTFENILGQITRENINKIIIAGDLFHKDFQNYSEFDTLTSKYKNIEFHIISGNHDSMISQKHLTSDNIVAYTEPIIKSFDKNCICLFLPYKAGKTMGEEIAEWREKLQNTRWVLIGHGDWVTSFREINPSEPGVYMPLSEKDIENYKPTLTVLGHIHKPFDDNSNNVHYVGSPCGLDITETGNRRFFIFDTESFILKPTRVDSEIIYFSETIIIYPMEDEEKYLKNQIEQMKNKWAIGPEEKAKVQIRVKVKGYSSDKRKLKDILAQEFSEFTFYNNEEVDISEVGASENYELSEISKKVCERINQIDWQESDEEPDKSEIMLQALKTIYKK